MFSFRLGKKLIFLVFFICLPLEILAEDELVSAAVEIDHVKESKVLHVKLLPGVSKRNNAQVSLEIKDLESQNKKTIFAKRLPDEPYTFEISEEEISYKTYKARGRVEIISTEAEELVLFSDWLEVGVDWPVVSQKSGAPQPKNISMENQYHWKGLILVLLSASWMYVLWNWVDIKLLSVQPIRKTTTKVDELPEELLSKVEEVCQNSSSESSRREHSL